MKLSKLFSAVFAILGGVLMAAVLVLCLVGAKAQPKADLPPEAAAAAEALLEALADGNQEGAQALIYGQPELGLSGAPADEAAALVWDALRNSLDYAFSGPCYLEGSSIYRDVTIAYLEVAPVSDAIPGLAREILQQKTANLEDLSPYYEEDGTLRSDVLQSILKEAAAQAIAAGETAEVSVKLQLLQKDGRWWVIPGKALYTALSGGTL